MVKSRVYGQQVVVKLFGTERILAPVEANFDRAFIIDFDKASVNKKVSTSSYRTIGKSITTHQPVFNGYSIKLDRTKRDDYLIEFLNILDMWHHSRNRPVEIMIERRITHTYGKSDINAQKEFQELSVANLRNSFVIDTLVNAGTRISALTPFNLKNSINKIQQSARNTVSELTKNRFIATGLDLYSNVSNLFQETQYIEIQKFVCCTVSEFDDNVEANDIYSESIGFDSSLMLLGDSDTDRTSITNYIKNLVLTNTLVYEQEQKDYTKNAMQFLGQLDDLINNTINIANQFLNYDNLVKSFTKGTF